MLNDSPLFSAPPQDWRDLQRKVADLLRVCGFSVEVEKTIVGARGSVELDVYAEEVVKFRKYTIACECKHWKSNIPQSVIHGFRTVLDDIGANIGYIITTSDFQSGSLKASQLTNIRLLSWDAFQDEFRESWYPKIVEFLESELVGGMLSFNRSGSTGYLPEPDKTEVREIGSRYLQYYYAIKSVLYHENSFARLPLRSHLRKKDLEHSALIPDTVLDAPGFVELFQEILSINNTAFRQAAEIHNRNRHLKTEVVDGFVAIPRAIEQVRAAAKKGEPDK